MINFPKILQFGDRRVVDYFSDGEVEITEKIDGSMFGFGLNNYYRLEYRSKGQIMTTDPNPPKLFKPAMDEMFKRRLLIISILKPGEWIFGETLTTPRHNTLCYDHVPDGHLMVFGYWGNNGWATRPDIVDIATRLEYPTIPLLYEGPLPNLQELEKLLETPSCLGGGMVEGIVIKHKTAFWAGFGNPLPVMVKMVREDFKEKNDANWANARRSSESKIGLILGQYRTEARWQKARQHLAEQGLLEGRMQDMPKLVSEIERDLVEECKEEIKEELFKAVTKDLKRTSVRGLAEWLKLQLAQEACDKEGDKTS